MPVFEIHKATGLFIKLNIKVGLSHHRWSYKIAASTYVCGTVNSPGEPLTAPIVGPWGPNMVATLP